MVISKRLYNYLFGGMKGFSMLRNLAISINKRLKTTFEKNLFKASLAALKNIGDPIRYNSFAFSMRELTRHFLNRLAPDEKIIKCSWYNNETKIKDGVTRKQRALYAIKGGLNDDFLEEELGVDLSPITKEITKKIDDLSKYTHIEEKTFSTPSNVGDKFALDILKTVDEFLKTISKFRKVIISAYETAISNKVDDAITAETIPELDQLATHYWIDGVWVNGIKVVEINESVVKLSISGSVDVEHQYGSDLDMKSGNGAQFGDSYPFTVDVEVDVEDPINLRVNSEDIHVDNSQFYGPMDDE
ncbi:MAG: hypothetical protein HQM08_27705 [Candidatus Riflebacteria bacterium]|nr:hypothetical protein [Candidatus Riflebacteria bacterium]